MKIDEKEYINLGQAVDFLGVERDKFFEYLATGEIEAFAYSKWHKYLLPLHHQAIKETVALNLQEIKAQFIIPNKDFMNYQIDNERYKIKLPPGQQEALWNEYDEDGDKERDYWGMSIIPKEQTFLKIEQLWFLQDSLVFFKIHSAEFSDIKNNHNLSHSNTYKNIKNEIKNKDKCYFKRNNNGMYWEICFNGKIVSIKGFKGLSYIYYLMFNKDQVIKALQLRNYVHNSSPCIKKSAIDQSEVNNFGFNLADTDIHEDRLSNKIYREAISNYENEIQIAQDNSEREKVEELEEKMKKLKSIKKHSNDNDNARKSVASAINYAIEKLKKEDVNLVKHLKKQIKVGSNCKYTTAKDISWEIL